MTAEDDGKKQPHPGFVHSLETKNGGGSISGQFIR